MDVVLCWHMHQPDYRLQGGYHKPWTWLHAIKDYTDMAAHLEDIPGARAVVNFSPVLIEQLRDYPDRIRSSLEYGTEIGDPILDALLDHSDSEQQSLLPKLVRAHEERMKNRFAPYAHLFNRANEALSGGQALSDQELSDLLVWYVIVWLGESLRDIPLVTELTFREGGYSQEDRRWLLSLLADLITDILPRYRRLAEAGKVELSVTPYSHPILPLMLDFSVALEAMPGAPLPPHQYPEGKQRCHWQLEEARRVFREAFGSDPAGCWPSEGGLSHDTLLLLGENGFKWTASGSRVLLNSLQRSEQAQPAFPQLEAWRPSGENLPTCFFRDDGLSDLIGFEYSRWQADDAINHFVEHLEQLRAQSLAAGQQAPVLSIIMDGENAWEYYPENAQAFLTGLYRRLAEHPVLNLTTFSEVCETHSPQALPSLCAGSWVHGTFSTWIGNAAKNRAWELLCEAAQAVIRSGKSDEPAIQRQLAVCEASDWSWWLAEHEQSVDEAAFDALYRYQLTALYSMIGELPPESLKHSIGGQAATAHGECAGTMRRSGW